MTHNNITLNLSKCNMTVAKAKLSKQLVWTPLCANFMTAEENLCVALKLSFTFLLSYMQMCMSNKTVVVFMWGSRKRQLSFCY